MRGRTLKLMAVAGLATLALTACSSGRPGAAAVVEGETISVATVDNLASALCVTSGGQPTGPISTKEIRNGAVNILIQALAMNTFGESEGATYDPQQLNAVMQQNSPLFALLDEDSREEFTRIVEDYVRGQLMVTDLGRQALVAAGSVDPDDQTSRQAGLQLLANAGLDIEVDPRFGTVSGVQAKLASGSLSVPVSSQATSGADTGDAAWIASLPAFQKCG